MIGTLLTSVSSLASSYLEGKTAIQKAEATIRMKEATGEIDWEVTFAGEGGDDWAGEDICLTSDGGAVVAVDNSQFGFLKVSPV